MAKKLTWDDAEDIGIQLSEKHPELDPLADPLYRPAPLCDRTARLRRRPKASNEGKLEAIQMAWHEEFQDRTQA